MTHKNPGDRNDPKIPAGENQVVQTNPDGYGSGYRHGQAVERQRYASVQQVRDDSNTANGFLIGILLTGLVLGGGALAYFLTQRPTIQRSIVVPSVSPSPSPSPQVKERVIERDRIVPVPQPQQSAPTVVPAPSINIEVPKPAPADPTPQASPPQSNQPRESVSPEPSNSVTPSPSPESTASPNSSGSDQ